MSSANLPAQHLFKSLKLELAKHLNGASDSRKELERNLDLSASAVASLQACFQRTHEALKVHKQVAVSIEHLLETATLGAVPISDLKRDLADKTFQQMDTHNEYDNATNEAWTAWRQAIDCILKAGKSRKLHGEILEAVQILSMEVKETEQAYYVDTIRAVIQRGDVEVENMIITIAGNEQAVLLGALKKLDENKREWDQLDTGSKMTAQGVRVAIARLEKF
ncbi:hypothetical protein P154DRAFT_576221 [Amniculicola lignicola CBS 123094]|uniref:Uncharacterized protein n=1 Tax=Amniculicola lignicola CBS 123094 TaxID=1392246 RepID=A0A6A5WFK3_9PLEO|nr:hypothetical protein P154DRAFT_576221 [Amniculicola lignicola CBS 123094]